MIQIKYWGISLVIISFLFSLTLLTPTPTAAQGIAQLAECSGPDCGTCHVIKLANGLIMWLIGFIFLLFAVLLMRAGVLLVISGGNPGALQSAKDNFINALIGLVIILAAWLIVDTIMRALVGPVGNEGQFKMIAGERTGYLLWSQITCTAQVTPHKCVGSCIEEILLEADAAIVDGTNALQIPPGGTGSNCNIDESTLVSIPGQSGQRATADTVNRFVSMQSRLAATGVTLGVTSSYRPDSLQTQLWDNCPICQSQGTVARPCSRGGNGSAHTSGLALDLSSSGDRCNIVRACRWAGASFIMSYSRSQHIHCDWRGGGRNESLTISCP